MEMNRVLRLYICLILTIIISGCSHKPNDEIIQQDIKSKISTDPQMEGAQVEVRSTQGKVKVSGKVPSAAAKTELKKVLVEEPKVVAVDDETSIEPQLAPPLPPAPTFSAAQKIGMFVFPKNNQDRDQQLRDELDCYNMVQQQTGVNPDTPPPAAPTSADVEAAQKEAIDNAEEAKGGRVRGAARGAAGGAAIGAIAGSAGKGAAAGAVAGTMRGGMQQRQTNAQNKQQAAQQATTEVQQQYNQAKTAYNQKLDTFKRGFSACMDSRNYSVK